MEEIFSRIIICWSKKYEVVVSLDKKELSLIKKQLGAEDICIEFGLWKKTLIGRIKSLLSFLTYHVPGGRYYSKKRKIVIFVDNLTKKTLQDQEIWGTSCNERLIDYVLSHEFGHAVDPISRLYIDWQDLFLPWRWKTTSYRFSELKKEREVFAERFANEQEKLFSSVIQMKIEPITK